MKKFELWKKTIKNKQKVKRKLLLNSSMLRRETVYLLEIQLMLSNLVMFAIETKEEGFNNKLYTDIQIKMEMLDLEQIDMHLLALLI